MKSNLYIASKANQLTEQLEEMVNLGIIKEYTVDSVIRHWNGKNDQITDSFNVEVNPFSIESEKKTLKVEVVSKSEMTAETLAEVHQFEDSLKDLARNEYEARKEALKTAKDAFDAMNALKVIMKSNNK